MHTQSRAIDGMSPPPLPLLAIRRRPGKECHREQGQWIIVEARVPVGRHRIEGRGDPAQADQHGAVLAAAPADHRRPRCERGSERDEGVVPAQQRLRGKPEAWQGAPSDRAIRSEHADGRDARRHERRREQRDGRGVHEQDPPPRWGPERYRSDHEEQHRNQVDLGSEERCERSGVEGETTGAVGRPRQEQGREHVDETCLLRLDAVPPVRRERG
jgi:hypothetical protein